GSGRGGVRGGALTGVAEPISLRTRPYAEDLYRGYDQVAVRPQAQRGPALHIVLFAATFVPPAAAVAFNQGLDVFAEPHQLIAGFPYAIAIMTILLFHECGHYFLARIHDVDATLPFFIPAPHIPFFIACL